MAAPSGSSRRRQEARLSVSRPETEQPSLLMRRRIMNYEPAPQPIDILLVEDNEADVRLTQEVLMDSKVRNNLIIANDGAQALACLRRGGKYKNTAQPDLILLDLDLTVKDGREVLAHIQKDPDFESIPP